MNNVLVRYDCESGHALVIGQFVCIQVKTVSTDYLHLLNLILPFLTMIDDTVYKSHTMQN